MRLMLVCVSAAKLPMVIESSAEIQMSGSQPPAICWKAVMKMRSEDGEGRGFGAGGHESADGRGRALIDVRRPHLEGRAGNLEAEAHDHQRGGDADNGERELPGVLRTVRISSSLVVPGDAVDDAPRRKGRMPVAKEPSRKYFSAASLLRLSSRR